MMIIDETIVKTTFFDKLKVGSIFKSCRSCYIYIKISDDEAFLVGNEMLDSKKFRLATDVEVIELDVELVIKGYK